MVSVNILKGKEVESSTLPPNWQITNISSVLNGLESGGRPRGGARGIESGIPSIGGEHLTYNGNFNFTNVRYIPLSYFERMTKGKIQKKDVLVVKDGATTGKTSYVTENFPYAEAAVNEHVFILRVFHDSFASKFLFYWLMSPFGQTCIKENFQGTAQGGITTIFIENSRLQVAPLEEQYRIVAKIEELFTQLDAGVASLMKAQAQLRRYRQAVLKAAFEGRLTQEWREEHKGKIEPASELLKKINDSVKKKTRRKYDIQNPLDVNTQPRLPKEWVLTQIQDVGDVQLGRQRAPEHHHGPNMRSYLRVANVFENRIDINDVKSMNFTDDEFDIYHLEYGDILLNEGQSKELVGRPAMFRNEIRDVCFQNTLVRFRVYEGVIPEYALHLFLFYLQNGRFLKIASQSTNIAHLGAERFAKMSFPFAPYLEQKEILLEIDRHLSQIDHLERTITISLRQAESLRQSILKRAFEGKLVPQDPTDEPASILLERIKAEKARHATTTKKGKTLQPKSSKRKIKNGN